MRYSPAQVEAKWRERWLKERLYEPDFKRARRPFYNLMMFPYPSAEGLHIGGMRTFTGVDIYGRFKRMQGYNVFEPIGLDGFGIHSENFAIKIGKHPAEHARDSEENFYRQLGMMGNGFAWEERLETYDPEYYKWTQWIFVQMFQRGLAYRKHSSVNWCPSCLTVLADEQVLAGACERCGTAVIKKELEQWFFRITDYAERLLQNLETIDWSEKVKIAQRNWIGRSEGALIKFQIPNSPAGRAGSKFQIEVFTTRPDTLFGATYVVLSPEHPLIEKLESRIQNLEAVRRYIHETKQKTAEERIAEGREKTGVELKGVKAVNPTNKEEIPVWIADYVLGHVGTGAIMAVPAHDERDFEFAKKFRLPIREAIEPVFTQSTEPGKVVPGLSFDHRDAIIAIVKHWSEEKYIGLKWKKVAWGTFITGGIEKGQTAEEAAKMEIREETGFLHPALSADFGMVHGKFYHVPQKVNRFSHARVLYFELQDGAREEIAEAEQSNHETLWFTKQELKKFLTPDSHQWALELLNGNAAYTGEGVMTNSGKFDGMDSERAKWEITKFVDGERKVQYRLRDWLVSRQRYWGPPIPMIFCEVCRAMGRGERKDMPGWYSVAEKELPVELPYVKDFRPTGTGRSPLASVRSFYEARCPTCGAEARRETDVSDTFLDSAWYYLRYPSVRDAERPWGAAVTKKWLPVHSYIGGAEHAVLHLLYSRFLAMAFHDWGLLHCEEPFKKFRAHGLITYGGAKMSKSRGNIVSPDPYVRAFGIDAIRLYLAFLAPFSEGGDFRDEGIAGMTRFLNRLWAFYQAPPPPSPRRSEELERALARAVHKVSEDIEALRYNTAISALMVLLNEFEREPAAVSAGHRAAFLKLLAPFAPFIAEELWEQAGGRGSIHRSSWPRPQAVYLAEGERTLVIQINGRVRDRIEVGPDAPESEVREVVLARPKVQARVGEKPIRKFIYVPGRVANIVL